MDNSKEWPTPHTTWKLALEGPYRAHLLLLGSTAQSIGGFGYNTQSIQSIKPEQFRRGGIGRDQVGKVEVGRREGSKSVKGGHKGASPRIRRAGGSKNSKSSIGSASISGDKNWFFCYGIDFGSESWSMLMSFSVWSHCQCWCLSQTIADQRKRPRVQMNLPKSRNNCDLILLNLCLKNCIAHELHSSSCFDATLCEVEYFGCKQIRYHSARSFETVFVWVSLTEVQDSALLPKMTVDIKTTSTQQPIPRSALFSCDFCRMPPPALNAH